MLIEFKIHFIFYVTIKLNMLSPTIFVTYDHVVYQISL